MFFVLQSVAPLAAAWDLDRKASVFAVVTHKEGLAAGLAHEHFVVANDYEATIDVAGLFSDDVESAARFEFEVAVNDLRVDDPEQSARWQERLLQLELLGKPFAELSEKDRKKIRKSMLGKKQLNAALHPQISARLEEIRSDGDGSYFGTLHLTVADHSVSKEISFVLDGTERGVLRAEVTATFDFTDFGIKPYSAMLGSIRVANTFHIFVVLVVNPPVS